MESRIKMLLVATALLHMLAVCNCNHFRGGTISWRPTGKALEVEFTYKLGWTYGDGAGCTDALSGQYVDNTTFPWTCTGCRPSTTISDAGYNCLSASRSLNYEQGEYTFTHTFTYAGQFTVQYTNCCWIEVENGSGGGYWTIATDVDLRQRSDVGQPNSSPVYTGFPIYSIKYGCTSTIRLQVEEDADKDTTRCRWATGTECNSVCSTSANPNVVLNQNDCTLTFTANQKAGGIYAVAIMIEDYPNSTISIGGKTYTTSDVLSSVPVQFLLETPYIPSRRCRDRPIFVVPTPSGTIDVTVQQGGQLVLELYVQSVGANITSFALTGLAHVQKSAISSTLGNTDVYLMTLTWKPSTAQTGPHTVCAVATDSFGLHTDPHCIQIKIFDTDPCDSDPCQNYGTCIRVGTTASVKCTCLGGYTGRMCEIELNECTSKPCQNNATCTDIVNGFYCTCSPGFEGILCENDINECQSSPCMNRGTCTDHVNMYQCACLPGFTGSACQVDIDECISRPCFNNGTCLDDVNGYSCVCQPGFTGSNCETDIDECRSTPCLNNGTCLDHVNSYTCTCQPGYTGTLCAKDINECQSNPCLHNGTCFDLINNFFCGCEKGFNGTRCETDIDDCSDIPCLNGGNCTDLLNSFICTCPPAFTGEICQTGLDPCSSTPCKNNGKCESRNSTFFSCSCAQDWEGINCAYRRQNDSFVNSPLLTGLHMHYSECDCFLGNSEMQLCHKYNTRQSIGYGAIGTFLGMLSVVTLYILSECFLTKKFPSIDETTREELQIAKDDQYIKGDLGHDESAVKEKEVPVNQEKNKPEKVKQNIHGHKHRKCWACDVKYNGVPPPRFW